MEIKFYEKIGVRQWKKFVLWLMALLIRNPKARKGGNYYLAGRSLKNVKSFKKMLLFNASIHIWAISNNIRYFIEFTIPNGSFSFSDIFVIIAFVINLYCIMLQRYNWLRINKVLKKANL